MVSLIVFTAVVGMFLSTPAALPLGAFVFGTLGIALASGSAAAFNHILDRQADAEMQRTRGRPLPTGQLTTTEALAFAFAVGIPCHGHPRRRGQRAHRGADLYLAHRLLGRLYRLAQACHAAEHRHRWRRRAAPPVLGWAAITGSVAPDALLLFLIIFLWTPPHFWALALYREKEYARAGIPMLPVTHGSRFTRLQILLYTVLLAAVTVMPFATHMSGWLYLAGAIPLNIVFLYYVWRLYRGYSDALARKTFRYSIQYLSLLFALLLIDHYRLYIHEALQSALY